MAYWLLLEKSDETRISKGTDGYKDQTGEIYHYDSLVPNFKRVSEGDSIVIRKENDILGVGVIRKITSEETIKNHRRCPQCGSTDIRERKRRNPSFKCGKCGNEFQSPIHSERPVTSYNAYIESFQKFQSPPTVSEVKSCSTSREGEKAQNSILELDEMKIRTLLEANLIVSSLESDKKNYKGQGFGLSAEERKSVELRAMDVVRELYESLGWKVIDVSKSKPYDYLVLKGEEQKFVEVKGTTGSGDSVCLTYGEVNYARNNSKNCVLVVISSIQLSFEQGSWVASGGLMSTHFSPWLIDEISLYPTQFRYELAGK